MGRIEALVDQIKLAEQKYTVSGESARTIEMSTFVPLLGAFAVGKNTIMSEVSRIDSEFGRIRSFTTREVRPTETGDEYFFLPHTEETLETILGRIAANELLQFTIHPTTGRVYGSAIESHDATPFLMLDTLPSALPSLSKIPFGSVKKVAISAPPEAWLPRMEERIRTGNIHDLHKRLQEGIFNLNFSLGEGSGVRWVSNGDRDIGEVAEEFIAIVREKNTDDSEAREDGAQLARAMEQLSTTL